MSVKIGLVKCLSDRAKKLSSTKENLRQEVIHIREALKLNNYLDKLVGKYERKCKNKINNDSTDSDNNDTKNNMHVKYAHDNTNNKESKSSVVIPYKKGTSETLRRILNMAGRNKSGCHSNHPQNQLETSFVDQRVNPVDPSKQNNLVYLIPCLR
uniref:Helix-turn-helix domain-containing protein n=1 Tax=Trichobilharzia regenti TaxID=157069 RepID=A0AA85JLE9_TRIRE|nr:unnamed protein product [Trichobilharzia regenti]